jgi:hypothetical protein
VGQSAARQRRPLAGPDQPALISRHDFLHDPERTFAVWREILPDARIDWVEDASRLMAMSHADLIARTLLECQPPS